MAVRGVYTEDEKKMLEETRRDAANMVGWGRLTVRTQDQIARIASSADPWNPLFNDENYARGTRWGHLIAAPFTLPLMVGRGGQFSFKTPSSVGPASYVYVGEDWEFYRPVYAGDEYRTWFRSPEVEDVTPLDGKGPRTFKILAHDMTYINQRDELVGRCKAYLEGSYQDEPGKRARSIPSSMPEYAYTKEELELIKRMGDEEEVRGANFRWWEDVSVGEELRPVIMGPTTIADMAGFGEAVMPLPMSKMRQDRPQGFSVDPKTGVSHVTYEVHLWDKMLEMQGTGGYAFHYGNYGRAMMGRVVTNWIGDDGWMKTYKWRHMIQTRIGDTLIGRGRVTNKRVENDEHLVDISVWLENFRGNVTEVAVATVSLCSKEEPIPFKFK